MNHFRMLFCIIAMTMIMSTASRAHDIALAPDEPLDATMLRVPFCCDQTSTTTSLACQLNELEAAINQLLACAATPITGVTTITASGTYCLSLNVAVGTGAAITIAADNVTLDFNGHPIIIAGQFATDKGISATGHNALRILNGAIQGVGGGSLAIDLTNCSGVTINNINYESVGTGIRLTTCNGVVLSCLKFDSITNGDAVLARTGTTNLIYDQLLGDANLTIDGSAGTVSNVKMTKNQLFSSGDTQFINVTAARSLLMDHNTATMTIADTNGALLSTCYVTQNATSISASSGIAIESGTFYRFDLGFDGLVISNSSTAIARECTVETGIYTTSANLGVGFIDCVSIGQSGLRFSLSGSNLFVRRCTAVGTLATGFANGSTSNIFFENLAANIATGFTGVTTARVSSPQNARGVDNVAGNLSTIDQAAAALTSATSGCSQIAVIDSKIDKLLTLP